MAKKDKKTEKVAASTDVATTPVENVQDTKATDAKAQQEADAKAQQEADAKAQQEADAKAKQEADAKDKEEAENRKPVKGYGFTADAPKSIRYNGEVYTQEEVLTNEDLLAELVQGKCIFIKRN